MLDYVTNASYVWVIVLNFCDVFFLCVYFVKVTVVAYIETWSNRVTREGGGGHGVEGGWTIDFYL